MVTLRQTIYTILGHMLKAAVAGGAAVVLVLFSARQIDTISSTLQQKRALSFALERRTGTTAQLKVDLMRIGNGDQVLQNALPPADNILEFVSALENLVKDGPAQQSFSFSLPVPLPDNEQLASVDFSLSVRANFPTLIAYLKNFERMPYFAGIKSVNISARTASGWAGESTVTLPALLYVRQAAE